MRRKNSRRSTVSLGVTRLEDRALPATTITVAVGANGSGSLDAFLFDATPGVIATIDGGDNPSTLSTGALAAVGSATDISVTSTSGITFNDLGGTLTLQPGAGRSVTFNAGSGRLSFTNSQNDTLATGGASITMTAVEFLTACNLNSAGGNVSLTGGAVTGRAIQAGPAGNISVQGSNLSFVSVAATGSIVGQNVMINGARMVVVGAVSGTNVSIVSQSSSITPFGLSDGPIESTGQLTLEASTGISVNTLAASIQATNDLTGDVNITQAATPARPLTTAGSGVRNLAAFGSVTLTNLAEAITVAAGAPVMCDIGTATLAALDFDIAGTIQGGLGTTLANSTAGREIDLGTNSAGRIGLTQAELNNVRSPLRVGSASAGPITIKGAITATANWDTLTLASGAEIIEASGGSLTVARLAISGARAALAIANNVGTVAASVSGNDFALVNNGPLIIGTVDELTGITSTAGNVLLSVDTLDVQQPINAGNNLVQIVPVTAGRPMSLGGEVSARLSLTDTELDRMTAGVLRVGDLTSGSLALTGPVTRHAGYNTLSITTGGTISQSDPVSVANLLVRTGGRVTLTNSGNDFDTLAAQVTGGDRFFSAVDADELTIGTVDGFVGIVTNAGRVTLDTDGSILDGNGPERNVEAANLTVHAFTSIDLDTRVNLLSAVLFEPGSITLTEFGTATIDHLSPGVTPTGISGTIMLDGGTFVLGRSNAISRGSLTVAGATLNLVGFNESLSGVVLASGSITGTGVLSSDTTFDVRSGTISARLAGDMGLIKATAGKVTLSGADTYTGATRINGGTLLINGSLAGSGAVTVSSGGTLGGTGTVVAPVIVNSSGKLAPGVSSGILNTGNLQFASGATFVVDVNPHYATAGTDYDRVTVTGSVNLNSANLSLVGGAVAATAGMVLTIISNDGTDAVSGTFAGLPQGSSVGVGSFKATISYFGGDGNDVTLTTVAAVGGAGGNITPRYRIYGDVNDDGVVDAIDLAAFRNAFGTVSTDPAYVPLLDFNGDGAINGTDLAEFRNHFGVIVP